MNDFTQRLILMIIGSIITYVVLNKVMHDQGLLEKTEDVQDVTKKLSELGFKSTDLNKHEKDMLRSVVVPSEITETMDDVIGQDYAKNILHKLVITPYLDELNTINGVILHGVPGNGKTMIVFNY